MVIFCCLCIQFFDFFILQVLLRFIRDLLDIALNLVCKLTNRLLGLLGQDRQVQLLQPCLPGIEALKEDYLRCKIMQVRRNLKCMKIMWKNICILQTQMWVGEFRPSFTAYAKNRGLSQLEKLKHPLCLQNGEVSAGRSSCPVTK